MTTLFGAVRSCLEDSLTPLWWPGLARRLVHDFCASEQVDLAGYSTTFWKTGERPASQDTFTVRSKRRSDLRTEVEVLGGPVRLHYEQAGHRFWQAGDLAHGSPLERLSEALDEIALSAELADMTSLLVRRTHLLAPHDDAFDVNFSEPQLPFSIFVGVPRGPVARLQWRLAEAVAHEASHLQLSLVERFVPLIESSDAQHFSPWQRCQRPIGGVLHGLYVFGVIAEWICRSSAPAADIQQRLLEIYREVDQVAGFDKVQGLTGAGSALARNILSRFKSGRHCH